MRCSTVAAFFVLVSAASLMPKYRYCLAPTGCPLGNVCLHTDVLQARFQAGSTWTDFTAREENWALALLGTVCSRNTDDVVCPLGHELHVIRDRFCTTKSVSRVGTRDCALWCLRVAVASPWLL